MSATFTREASSPPATAAPLITLERVEKVYRTGKLEYRALRGVDLSIGTGEMVAVVGPSGSGKTTILNLITGIDRPTAGTVTVDGQRLDRMSEEQLARLAGRERRHRLPVLPAAADADRARERDAAARLRPPRLQAASGSSARSTTSSSSGSATSVDHLPAELSGGEQQRVAIARALACRPEADRRRRADGNLDTRHSRRDVRAARSG